MYTHLRTSAPAKSACAICWENIILHSHPEIEISFKFIPKILMSEERIHFFGPLYIYIYIYCCVHVCVCVCVYIYTWTQLCSCMYVYIYIYIHTHTLQFCIINITDPDSHFHNCWSTNITRHRAKFSRQGGLASESYALLSKRNLKCHKDQIFLDYAREYQLLKDSQLHCEAR